MACAELTEAFLDYSASLGNDLKTPRPEYNFPGLKAGLAPKIDLAATHINMLDFVELETLEKFSVFT